MTPLQFMTLFPERIVALLACYFASREYVLAPGERVYVGVFAPDRKQAGITFRYFRGL